jgi:hypothetical protein
VTLGCAVVRHFLCHGQHRDADANKYQAKTKGECQWNANNDQNPPPDFQGFDCSGRTFLYVIDCFFRHFLPLKKSLSKSGG